GLVVADADEPRLAPAGAPAVLEDPALLGVVVADDRDAVVAGQRRARRLDVDAAGVGEEVVEDRHPGEHRTGGNGILPRVHRALARVVRDLPEAVLPVGAAAGGAVHVRRLVGHARFVDDAGALGVVEAGRQSPAVATAAAAELQEPLGEVDGV